jgi:hypothetical protein
MAKARLPSNGKLTLNWPSWKPSSGAVRVTPPKGSGIGGRFGCGSWGRPGIGFGSGNDPGVVFGMVSFRAGMLILAIAKDEVSVTFPLPSATALAVE